MRTIKQTKSKLQKLKDKHAIEFSFIKSLMGCDGEEEHLESLHIKNLQREVDTLREENNMELQLVAEVIYSNSGENNSKYLQAMYQILYCEGWVCDEQEGKD